MTGRFGEVLTAMLTPFSSDGSLNVEAARDLAVYLVEHGNDGLVVCGTTGESPTLSEKEKLTLFEAVVDAVGDRAKIIAGTGTYDTAESVALTRQACKLGVDGILIVTPYYSRPPQNGLLAHFTTIADASDLPLMVYDIPGRTGRRIERPTMVQLAEHERIVAVKDAVGDAGETAKLRSDLDLRGFTDFEIYSGDDPLLLPHLAAGAIGIVSVCAHAVGAQIKQIVSAWSDGKVEEAQRIFIELQPFLSMMMTLTASPIPIKAAMAMLGHDVGIPRLPLVDATEDEKAAIRSALELAGLV